MPDFRIPLPLPSVVPLLPPRNTPTIRDQLECPEGYYRSIKTGACIPKPEGAPSTRPPTVFDPDTGGIRPCATDDECENPEDHQPPPCPPGYTRSGFGGKCARPFVPGFPALSFLGLIERYLGKKAPRRSPGPSRRRAPRRRAPPPKRPPARPRRPPPGAPVRRTPRRAIPWPDGFPAPTLNPIDFVIDQFYELTRDLGQRTGMNRRGGNRTRMPPTRMPPVTIPVPSTIPVVLPRPQPMPARRTSNAEPVPGVPARAPITRRAPAPRPRSAPRSVLRSVLPGVLSNVLVGLLSPALFSPPTAFALSPMPRAQPQPRPAPRPLSPQPIGDPLTPVQGQQLGFATVASPDADPCAVRARDARRRQRKKRKECKKFTYRKIKVCADKGPGKRCRAPKGSVTPKGGRFVKC